MHVSFVPVRSNQALKAICTCPRRAYAQAEFAPISESGGRITRYYAPTEFAGATSEAFATIDVGTMAEYEIYRARLAEHPKHKENVRKIEQSGAIHSVYRAMIQRDIRRSPPNERTGSGVVPVP